MCREILFGANMDDHSVEVEDSNEDTGILIYEFRDDDFDYWNAPLNSNSPGQDDSDHNDSQQNYSGESNHIQDDSDQEDDDWPAGIEPFNLADLELMNDPHNLPSIIADFDTYRREVETQGYHPLIDHFPADHPVLINVETLLAEAVACVFRLASNPNILDEEDIQIHTICRLEWITVLQRLHHLLKPIAEREATRQCNQWSGLSVWDLFFELRVGLWDYPRLGNRLQASSRRNREVVRFRGQVDELVRWVVTRAACEYAGFRAEEGDERFDARVWWVGVLEDGL